MIELLDDPGEFARRAGALLESSPRNTVLATVLEGVLRGHYRDPRPRFAIVGDGTGAVTGAALRTPPWPLTCTALDGPEAVALIERWVDDDPRLDGVNAVAATARVIATAWSRLTGGRARLGTAMALHSLAPAKLRDPPRPAPGRLRAPHPVEHARLIAWEWAFVREAELEQTRDTAERMTRTRIEEGRALVWDVDGEAVCLVGHTPMVAGVPRVGPVYTPPVRRNRGYASSAVGALSRRLFDAGAREVVLFTDLANPTSNKIYADVGYRRIADWERYSLER